jgi:hypothetical protein
MLEPNREIWRFCDKEKKNRDLRTRKPKKSHFFTHFEEEEFSQLDKF